MPDELLEVLIATPFKRLRPEREGLADWLGMAEGDDALVIAQWPERSHRRRRQALAWLRAQATPIVAQIVAGVVSGVIVAVVLYFLGLV